MMDVTNFIDSELLYHLEYGKLYLFVSSDRQAQAYSHLLKSSLRHSINLGWLSKMEVVTVYVPEVNRLGMVIAARKVNAGNIGRYSVLACVIQSMHTLDDGLLAMATTAPSHSFSPKSVWQPASRHQGNSCRLKNVSIIGSGSSVMSAI